MLRKIISGGQTGVDRSALDVALELGLEIGGWCPPGREALDGTIPLHYPLKETHNEFSHEAPNVPRSQRTERNVRDSDGTLVILPASQAPDPGTQTTIMMADKMNKPYYVVDPTDAENTEQVCLWMREMQISTLNVAGPSEKTLPGIELLAGQWLRALLIQMRAGC